MEDELLDDIDTLERPNNFKKPIFKKKNVKNKKSTSRVKISYDDQDGDDNDDDSKPVTFFKKQTKSVHKFNSTTNTGLSKRFVAEKPMCWKKDVNDAEHENDKKDNEETFASFVKTIQTGEDGPVIEDLDRILKNDTPQLQVIPDVTITTKYIPLENTKKKYVPIENNKEPTISYKQYKNEYENDLDDNETNIDDLDDDVRVISHDNDDYIADNDDLDLTGNRPFQIDNDIYDLELPNDASDMSDTSSMHIDSSPTVKTNRPIKISQILSISDQINAVKSDVEKLKITIIEQQAEQKSCISQAQQLKLKRTAIQNELSF